jgi:hypothetical protein
MTSVVDRERIGRKLAAGERIASTVVFDGFLMRKYTDPTLR